MRQFRLDLIKQQITEWLKEILVGGIMNNLSGMFGNVNRSGRADRLFGGNDATGMEHRHLQHNPNPVRKRHDADCRSDSRVCHNAGTDSDRHR
jgi:hypothetical protein